MLPYPNPTAGPARFFVDHNQPVGTSARVQLRIYTLAGRPVRTIDGARPIETVAHDVHDTVQTFLASSL